MKKQYNESAKTTDLITGVKRESLSGSVPRRDYRQENVTPERNDNSFYTQKAPRRDSPDSLDAEIEQAKRVKKDNFLAEQHRIYLEKVQNNLMNFYSKPDVFTEERKRERKKELQRVNS